MRIALFTNEYPPNVYGGAGVHVEYLSRELAREHGLRHLSIGTSQDYAVAVEEGATIVRLGSVLFD